MQQAIDMIFHDMDVNQDAKISKKEWNAYQDKQFGRLDRNGDGFLTREEIMADMQDRMKESRPQAPSARPAQ